MQASIPARRQAGHTANFVDWRTISGISLPHLFGLKLKRQEQHRTSEYRFFVLDNGKKDGAHIIRRFICVAGSNVFKRFVQSFHHAGFAVQSQLDRVSKVQGFDFVEAISAFVMFRRKQCSISVSLRVSLYSLTIAATIGSNPPISLILPRIASICY